MVNKAVKKCSSCETKYTVVWDIEEQDLDPWTCPFCGGALDKYDEDEIEVISAISGG